MDTLDRTGSFQDGATGTGVQGCHGGAGSLEGQGLEERSGIKDTRDDSHRAMVEDSGGLEDSLWQSGGCKRGQSLKAADLPGGACEQRGYGSHEWRGSGAERLIGRFHRRKP